jgi:hypothetical protein
MSLSDSLLDEEHRAIGIKLMRRTENESPDKVVWFSLTLCDIILRAILLPNLLPNSFLSKLPTNITQVCNNSSKLGWHRCRQPGLSTCIISDRDFIYSWAQEIIEGYDIVIVHTDDSHFVTWINRLAVHPDRSISTGSLQVQAWSSTMKRLRSRGTMPNKKSFTNQP